MGKNILSFLLTFAVAFGAGFLFYQSKEAPEQASASETVVSGNEAQTPTQDSKAKAETTVSAEGQIFVQRGCTACHAVSALGVEGGSTGPDLSKAFVNVPDKHGATIEEFLKKPTSAVMSGVLGGNPLKEDELKALVAALKAASEK